MTADPYITIAAVAKILGWTHHKANRWLTRAGALVCRGGRRVTTLAKLRECFPEVYAEIQDAAYDPASDPELS